MVLTEKTADVVRGIVKDIEKELGLPTEEVWCGKSCIFMKSENDALFCQAINREATKLGDIFRAIPHEQGFIIERRFGI